MKHLEDNIQIACVTWFSFQYPDIAILLHHSPNGGKRNIREAARFKAMGVRAGFPDLILLYPSSGYNGLLIEMKTEEKSSRQSPNQKAYQQAATSHGYKYIVCRSFDDFNKEVKEYLGLKRINKETAEIKDEIGSLKEVPVAKRPKKRQCW